MTALAALAVATSSCTVVSAGIGAGGGYVAARETDSVKDSHGAAIGTVVGAAVGLLIDRATWWKNLQCWPMGTSEKCKDD